MWRYSCPVSYMCHVCAQASSTAHSHLFAVPQGPPVVCFKLATLLEALFPEGYRAQAAVLAQQNEQIVQSAEAVEVIPRSGCLQCGLSAVIGVSLGIPLQVVQICVAADSKLNSASWLVREAP